MQLLNAHFNSLAILLTILCAPSLILVAHAESVCGALPVLDTCLASTQQIANACPAADYNCLCEKWTEVVKCFLQCPSDIRQAAPNAYQSTYCSNAKVYGNSNTTPVAAVVSPASAVPAPSTAAQSGSSGSGSSNGGSATSSAAPSSSSSSTSKATAAPKQAVNMASGRFEFNVAGGVLVGVALVVGMFL